MTDRRRFLLSTAAAVATPGLCGAAHAQAAVERIVVAGWSKPITEVTPLLVDEDKGFYRAQGVALEYLPGAGGGDTGKSDFWSLVDARVAEKKCSRPQATREIRKEHPEAHAEMLRKANPQIQAVK